jgi:isoleucyl-tRNA synthetase
LVSVIIIDFNCWEEGWYCYRWEGTLHIFRQGFTLEDAIGSHACSLEASMRVTNGISLGCSLLLLIDTVNSVQTRKAPFKTVVTHGFVVDAQGKKMSKSIGNGVDPQEVINGGKDKKKEPAYGADVLRMWVANSTYTADVSIGPDALSNTFEQLRKVRNSGRFLLGNLAGFNPESDLISYGELKEIDQFMLHRIHALSAEMVEGYESYNMVGVSQALSGFVTQYLNSFTFEIYKDRLYLDEEASTSRRSAQTVMHYTLQALSTYIAPIACHLAEELHSFQDGVDPAVTKTDSVMKQGWFHPPGEWNQPELAAKWEEIRDVRRQVFRAIEDAKQNGTVNGIADAAVTIRTSSAATKSILDGLVLMVDDVDAEGGGNNLLVQLLLCSTVSVEAGPTGRSGEVEVTVTSTSHHKCPRCWRFTSPTADSLCCRCKTVVDGAQQ